jgi:hypothetical protein
MNIWHIRGGMAKGGTPAYSIGHEVTTQDGIVEVADENDRLGDVLDMNAWMAHLQPPLSGSEHVTPTWPEPTSIRITPDKLHKPPYALLSMVSFAPAERYVIMPHPLPPAYGVFREPWFNKVLNVPGPESVYHRPRNITPGA